MNNISIMTPNSPDVDWDILTARVFFDNFKVGDTRQVDIPVGSWDDKQPIVMIKCTRLNYEQKIKGWWEAKIKQN